MGLGRYSKKCFNYAVRTIAFAIVLFILWQFKLLQNLPPQIAELGNAITIFMLFSSAMVGLIYGIKGRKETYTTKKAVGFIINAIGAGIFIISMLKFIFDLLPLLL